MRHSDLITEDNDPNDPHLKYIASLVQTDEGSMYWIDVQPPITGFKMTFWVSCDADFPYFIVDPTPGNLLLPTKRCKAFYYWKSSKYPEIDEWMGTHKKIIQDLLEDKIDGGDFYRLVRQILSESETEMLNLSPAKTGLKYTIWCSPKQHPADIRIKVIPNKKQPNDNVTIAVRTNVVKGTGLSNSEIKLIRKWIVLNAAVLEDFWKGNLETAEEFYAKIKSIAGRENDPELDWDEYIENLKQPDGDPEIEKPNNKSKKSQNRKISK